MIDENGNTIERKGIVTEIVTPGPALQAEMDAARAANDSRVAKVAANRDALDVMARKARRLARGVDVMPSTVAGRDALLKDLCEAFARQWFNESFGDPAP